MRVHFRHSFAVAVALLALTGCQAGQRSVLVSRPDLMRPALPDDCGAAAVADLRGRPFAELAGRTLTGDLRVIRMSEAVTSEIDPRRINAMVDERGFVVKFFCG
jgi:uncharacterized lipoprotein YajG